MTENDVFQQYKNSIKSVKHTEDYIRDPEKDFTRKRILTLEHILNSILRMSNKSYVCETADYCLSEKIQATPSAFREASSKIKPEAFEHILHVFTNSIYTDNKMFDLNIFAVDGSSVKFQTNDKLSDTYHGKVNQYDDAYYNDYHLNTMYSITTGLITDAVIQPGAKYNEIDALSTMIHRLPKGKNLIIADRAYEAYRIIDEFSKTNNFFMIRGTSNGIGSKYQVGTDEIVTLHLYRSQTKKAKSDPLYKLIPSNVNFDIGTNEKDGYYEMTFRIVRFSLPNGNIETILTNLPSHKYPSHIIKNLYNLRWNIETGFRRLKHTVGMLHFHSGKEQYILQEIWASLIVFNLASAMAEISTINNTAYAVNFSVAVTSVRSMINRIARPPDVISAIKRTKTHVYYHSPTNKSRRSTVQYIPFTYRCA